MEKVEVTKTLPKLLILTPPPVFRHHEHDFSHHFDILNFSTSTLPLPEFLAAANTTGVLAMFVCSEGPPINASTVLDYVPSVKLIISSAKGVDYIDLAECRRRGILVANAGSVSATDCADFTVGLVIDVLRKVSAADRFVRNGEWVETVGEFALGRRLGGKTVGIVGLGSIGSKIAKRLEGFGCRIMYNSRAKKQSFHYPYCADVSELAAKSDILILSCSLTDETRHIINKEVLRALGKDGILINVARGPVVNQNELVEFLMARQIAGAGLDVFEHEPSVPKELLTMSNVVLTHHQASFTEGCFRDLYELVKANIEAFYSNEPLLTPVV